METINNSNNSNLKSFQVVFNNQILELIYNTSLESYKSQTINSLIQKVLEQLGPKPLKISSENYILLCPCGKPLNPDNLISNSECDHSFMDKEKNKNQKYLLVEKNNNEKNEKPKEFFTNYEISQILMQATGAKKITNIKLFSEFKNKNFPISDDLKNKIKLLQKYKENGAKLLINSCDLEYNETMYEELLEIGIESNKIKAALRMTFNSKEEALLLATDPTFNLENKEYLYCSNDEVLTYSEYMKRCKEEVKKEYQNISEDEVEFRTKIVINSVNKGDKNINAINDSLEEESSLHEEESDEDSYIIEYSDSNAHESEYNQ